MKTLLLSIRPRYSSQVFGRTKLVELRRVRPRVQRGDRVIVYEPMPTCALVGHFRVGDVVALEPKRLWTRFRSVAGIAIEEYEAYFAGAALAYAICVENPRRFSRPVPLAEVRELIRGYTPPQGYHYLDASRPKDAAILSVV